MENTVGQVMEESERDSGEVSPDRPLKEDEEGDERTRENEDSQEKAPEEPSINSRKSETTTLYSTMFDLHKLSHIYETYSRRGGVVPRNIISIIRELIKPQRWAMFQYYLKHGAATVWILRYSLNMSKPAAYRWHKLLEESGLVEPKTTIAPIGKMKRPASVWGLPDATEAQVRDARQYHLKLTSPIYRKADKIAKRYLQEGKPAKTTEGELVRYLKEINEPPRMRQDLARMMLYTFSREAKAHALTDQSRREENLRRVLEIMRPPVTKLGPLYETLDSLDINDPDERAAIRDYFVNASAHRYENQSEVHTKQNSVGVDSY